MNTNIEVPANYLVVGAGPSGLIAARALLKADVEVEIVERHSAPGGIWDIDSAGSPMYETCHFITSKWLGGFLDFPMPDDYPMYPSWRLVLQYIRQMSDAYGLTERTRFGLEVVEARPTLVSDTDAWTVRFSDGSERLYRGVVYAGGQQWLPFKPDFEGEEEFQGAIITGNRYKDPAQFKGKRVLIVGAGNSGVDIAVDAAEHAEAAFLSTRRAYHFLPKQVFGVPTPDLLNGKVDLPSVPGVADGLELIDIINLALSTVGDLSHYGLPKPEGVVLGSTQPIVSDLVLHCFSHGTLKHRPNIKRFHATDVEFDDGSREEIDLVVFATGYDIDIPWLPEGAVDYEAGHPHFHLGGLALNVPNLYGIGVLHPSRADAWATFDQLAQLVVADIKATLTGENAEALRYIREEFRPNLKGDFPFLDVRRNVNQVDVALLDQLISDLETKFGITVPRRQTPGFYDSVRRQYVTV
ncbi:NAD(P)/FAD-dependent oxidoreductase [Arthrobacter sp. NPDC089319]|uniref:flavin-containing monooxygenase n=1 Tax=Arthrobacter sp. NPDC089319 TaxID=3155915 RepID=UPI00342A03B7